MKTIFSLTARSARAVSSMLPLRVVTRIRSPGHGAGMPMLKLAAGHKDKRVLRVGHLGGRQDLCRDKRRTPGFGGEAIAEDHGLARMIRRGTWIYHRRFLFEP